MKRLWILCLTVLLFLLSGCGKEAPLTLAVSGEGFTITNAEGKSLQYSGGAFSGDMAVREWQGSDSNRGTLEGQYFLEVPESKSFTCQWDEMGSHMFGLLPNYSLGGSDSDNGGAYREYTVSGDCLKSVTAAAEGEIVAVSGKGGMLAVAFSLPCDVLGPHGFVRFSGAGGEQASVRPDEAGSQFSFSGFLPGDCVLSYTGAEAGPWVTVILESGSGTLDFSRAAEGQIILQEDGCEAQILG